MNPDKNNMNVYIAKYLWGVAYVLRVFLVETATLLYSQGC